MAAYFPHPALTGTPLPNLGEGRGRGICLDSDADVDGYISTEELRAALIEKTGNLNNCLIDMMFQSLDVNNYGKVSMDELASLVM